MTTPSRSERASLRLAHWIAEFSASPMTEAVAERAKGVLLDSLGCALAAHSDQAAAMVLRQGAAVGGRADATVIGTRIRLPVAASAFVNGVLIRALDLNDSYSGPGLVGHPSDNIAVALAFCEFADRPLTELLNAIRLGYEIYGRLLDLMDPKSGPWDHTVASGLASVGMATRLMGLTVGQTSEALSLVASHCAVSREVRGKHISTGKSIAGAVVGQTACQLTLLAAKGATGPGEALDGPRGFGKIMFRSGAFDDFFAVGDRPERLLSSSIKLYPCFAIGQAPINAAIELNKRLGAAIAEIERVDLALADSAPAKLRLADIGHLPQSREAADHSLQFVVAAALVDGAFGLKTFDNRRWADPRVRRMMELTRAQIDPALPLDPPGAFPCRVTATLKGGARETAERLSTPGHASRPLAWPQVCEKFRTSSAAMLQPSEQDALVDFFAEIDGRSTAARLMQLTASKRM